MNMDLEIIEQAVHDADGLYQNAAVILGYEEKTLREFKSIAGRFELSARADKLLWRHHYEIADRFSEITLRNVDLTYNHQVAVASLKLTVEDEEGVLDFGETEIRLRQFKSMADTFKMLRRRNNVSYTHYSDILRKHLMISNLLQKS